MDAYPPDWVKRRRKVIKRDGGICNECGYEAEPADGVSLHVHHVKPISEGGGHSLENLITLCEDCHIETHSTGPPHPSRVEMGECVKCEREYPIGTSEYASYCSAVCWARTKAQGILNQVERGGRICATCYSRVQQHQEACPNCGNWDTDENNKALIEAEDIDTEDLLTFAKLMWEGHGGF